MVLDMVGGAFLTPRVTVFLCDENGPNHSKAGRTPVCRALDSSLSPSTETVMEYLPL